MMRFFLISDSHSGTFYRFCTHVTFVCRRLRSRMAPWEGGEIENMGIWFAVGTLFVLCLCVCFVCVLCAFCWLLVSEVLDARDRGEFGCEDENAGQTQKKIMVDCEGRLRRR